MIPQPTPDWNWHFEWLWTLKTLVIFGVPILALLVLELLIRRAQRRSAAVEREILESIARAGRKQ